MKNFSLKEELRFDDFLMGDATDGCRYNWKCISSRCGGWEEPVQGKKNAQTNHQPPPVKWGEDKWLSRHRPGDNKGQHTHTHHRHFGAPPAVHTHSQGEKKRKKKCRKSRCAECSIFTWARLESYNSWCSSQLYTFSPCDLLQFFAKLGVKGRSHFRHYQHLFFFKFILVRWSPLPYKVEAIDKNPDNEKK